MNFTALDFETANSSRASMCEVGLVRVEDSKIVEEVRQLIKPEGRFDWRCVQIHGIDEFDVRDSPNFGDFWNEMRPFLSDTVVAHNAAFDISCMRAEIEHYGLAPENFDYFCTLRLSRKFLPMLDSHKLDNVAHHFGVEDFRHHDALDDARACAKIFLSLLEKFDVSATSKKFMGEIIPLMEHAHNGDKKNDETIKSVRQKSRAESSQSEFPNMIYSAALAPRNPKNAAIKRAIVRREFNPMETLNFDFSEIDFSKTFAVTGIFASMSRSDVENLISYKGGNVSKDVDSGTDYLVVGGVRSPSWDRGEYGLDIDRALKLETVSLVSESHFLSFF